MAARDELDEEFREFVAARSFALLRTAYLLCGDWSTAEDLLQTALTKTYLAWRRLGEIEAVEPYARRVLVNTATSWWRRRWHGERPTEVLPERAAPDRIDEQVERDALWRHVQALPARQRAVLVLRFYEDLSETQTAYLLNISSGTVKSQTFRALNTLRQRLGAEADQLAPQLSAASAKRSSPPAPVAAPARPPTAPAPTGGPGPSTVPLVNASTGPADQPEPVGGSRATHRARHGPATLPAVTLRTAAFGEAP